MRRIVYFVLALMLLACSKDDAVPIDLSEPNAELNQWVYEQMQRYYYWHEGLPTFRDYNQEPKEFFNSLLVEQDRFSYLYHPQKGGTIPYRLSDLYGFEYKTMAYGEKVYGVIKFVLKDSPAKRAGLERGMLITKIENSTLTEAKANSLLEKLLQGGEIHFHAGHYNEELQSIENVQPYTLGQSFTFLQPIRQQVIETPAAKVGYLYLYHFDKGLVPTLLATMQDFKTAGINELVLDLRYNSGGEVSAAAALCGSIASGLDPSSVFVILKGNENGETVSQTFTKAITLEETGFQYNQLQAVNLGLQRVFILTSGMTASASELVINNLKPYMEVIQIGEKTLGKDVASFPIEAEDPKISGGWVLHPVIYKLFNADEEGNYATGLAPDYRMGEFQTLPVYPLGDTRELLLQKALSIMGNNAGKKEGIIGRLIVDSQNRWKRKELLNLRGDKGNKKSKIHQIPNE